MVNSARCGNWIIGGIFVGQWDSEYQPCGRIISDIASISLKCVARGRGGAAPATIAETRRTMPEKTTDAVIELSSFDDLWLSKSTYNHHKCGSGQ